MESKVTTSKQYTLVLNEAEAQFLKELTQNCLLYDYGDEPTESAKIRNAFFNAVYTGVAKNV